MTESSPRISIVTPCFNQAGQIGRTIDSVLAQEYPDLEHLVVDMGSSDGSLEVARGYAHLVVLTEPGRSPAEAVNQGFRIATGQILGILTSPEVLVPGALHRVARGIGPERGPEVVMGRSQLVDEQGSYTGVEHASRFRSSDRVLEIWKGLEIPRHAVFWTKEAWKACGPADTTVQDYAYDFLCRLSKRYRFYLIDQVLAAYQLPDDPLAVQRTEKEHLEERIRISRRYWGSQRRAGYWQLVLSHLCYRLDRQGRAQEWIRTAEEAQRHGKPMRAIGCGLAGTILAPEVAFYSLFYPYARGLGKRLIRESRATREEG